MKYIRRFSILSPGQVQALPCGERGWLSRDGLRQSYRLHGHGHLPAAGAFRMGRGLILAGLSWGWVKIYEFTSSQTKYGRRTMHEKKLHVSRRTIGVPAFHRELMVESASEAPFLTAAHCFSRRSLLGTTAPLDFRWDLFRRGIGLKNRVCPSQQCCQNQKESTIINRREYCVF